MAMRSAKKRRRRTARKKGGSRTRRVVVTTPERRRITFKATSMKNEDATFRRALEENNDKVLRRYADVLLTYAIPRAYVTNPVFRFGPLSCKEMMQRIILSEWKKEHQAKKDISFEMLVRSAQHTCTQEMLDSNMRRFKEETIPATYKVNNENAPQRMNATIARPIYQAFINSVNHHGTLPDIPETESIESKIILLTYSALRNYSQTVAHGFMEINKGWFTPEDWMNNKKIPTIKPGDMDRLLCGKTDSEKQGMSDENKKEHARKIVKELLGPTMDSMTATTID